MTEIRLTPWFGADQKPVYIGVYLTRINSSNRHAWNGFCWWNGKTWFMAQGTSAAAKWHKRYGPSVEQKRQWRGVLK